MMCQEFMPLMFEFCRGELEPNAMAECRTHLEQCESCQRELQDAETCFSMMKACCGSESIPADLAQKLRDLMGRCGGIAKDE